MTNKIESFVIVFAAAFIAAAAIAMTKTDVSAQTNFTQLVQTDPEYLFCFDPAVPSSCTYTVSIQYESNSSLLMTAELEDTTDLWQLVDLAKSEGYTVENMISSVDEAFGGTTTVILTVSLTR